MTSLDPCVPMPDGPTPPRLPAVAPVAATLMAPVPIGIALAGRLRHVPG